MRTKSLQVGIAVAGSTVLVAFPQSWPHLSPRPGLPIHVLGDRNRPEIDDLASTRPDRPAVF